MRHADDSTVNAWVNAAIFARASLRALHCATATSEGVVEPCGFIDSATRVAENLSGLAGNPDNVVSRFKIWDAFPAGPRNDGEGA